MEDFGIPVATDNSLADRPNQETTNFTRFITTFVFLFQFLWNIFNPAEIRLIWALQCPRVVAFVEQGDPDTRLCFVIKLLLALAQIKAQSISGFPFKTHHHFMTISATTVLLYAFISAVEKVVISFAGYDRTSLCVVVARLGQKSKHLELGNWILTALSLSSTISLNLVEGERSLQQRSMTTMDPQILFMQFRRSKSTHGTPSLG